MAMKTQSYDQPTYITRHFTSIVCPAVAASTVAGRFFAFTAMKIKSISSSVIVAGTNSASGYDILNGTSSVGAALTADSAANYAAPVYQTDISLASGGWLDLKTKASSATTSAAFTIEYEIPAGSPISA